MDRAEVLGRRVAAQQLAGTRAASALDVVRRLTCVQSQEHAHAFWSLGMRTTGADVDAVRAAFDAGTFLRTHVLRPTWHLVAAEDLRWILAATSDRVHQINASQLRREGLEPADLDRGLRVITETLTGRCLTRTEVARVLARAGLPDAGIGLAGLVMHAELEAAICSGPMRGSTHTYALLDERRPGGNDRHGYLAELAYRFVAGHGPASADDLCRWSSLTKTSASAALAAAGDRLASAEVEGTRLWFDPEGPDPVEPDEALLLPLYDEAALTFPKLTFPVAPGHPHQPGTDLFLGSVVLGGVNVGTWRRELKGRRVEVALALAPGVGAAGRRLVEEAVESLALFLRRELVPVP